MKRKELITKLMKEGLTEKTLVNMSDKQLGMLAVRLLSEQYGTTSTTGTPSVVNIPKEKTQDINTAKMKKQTFATYEGEVKEEDAKLGVEKKEHTEKSKAIAASNMKIKAAIKAGKDYGDYTRLIKKVNNGKLPESTQKIIDGKKLNEWVDRAVAKNVYPFTSKNEIMKLINIKLNEGYVEDQDTDVMEPPTNTAGLPQELPDTDVETEVGTEPDWDPDRDDPFRDPVPDIEYFPKANHKKEISADDMKNKIIKMMQDMI